MLHARSLGLIAASLAIAACGSDAHSSSATPVAAGEVGGDEPGQPAVPASSTSSAITATAPPPQTLAPAQPASKASWRDQVIYLVMPDRFRNGDLSNDDLGSSNCHDASDPQRFHGGDLAGVDQNLAYIEDLGATAIWVTPLYRQIGQQANGHCGYHGYWADYVAPYDDAMEPKFGTPSALNTLVADMHAKNMRFVLDMVVNHTGDTARLPQTNPTWFHDPATCASLGDPTIYCPLDHHPDFAQEKPEVAAYLTDVASRWTKTYGIDAIRMDTAKHVPPAYFAQSFMPAVKAINSDLFTVGEVFDEGSIDGALPYLNAGFTSAFQFPLRRALVNAIAKAGSVDEIASTLADGIAKVGMERALDLVLLIDNHDVQRFVNEPGVGVAEDDIQRRSLLALDLVFTLPGIPQLFYGDEIGMYGAGDPDNRRDFPTWAMDVAGRSSTHPGQAAATPAIHFDRVKKLAGLRKTTQAFVDGAYKELWRQNGAANPNVFAFARGDATTEPRVVIVNNGAANSGVMHIPVAASIFADKTALVDDLGDGAPATTTLQNGQIVIDLPPRSAAIYRRH